MIAVYLTDKLQFYNIFTKTTTISEFGFENNSLIPLSTVYKLKVKRNNFIYIIY